MQSPVLRSCRKMQGSISDELLVDRLAASTRLAELLDRGTLEVALRLVPLTW